MNNDEAREYFKQLGLVYLDITEPDINKLRNFVSKELENHTEFKMTLSRKNKWSYKIHHGSIHAEIRVDASYFNGREGITFNYNNHFIGFAGWACSENAKPFIDAFVKWCDWLKGNK